jgi:hypothetical protein
MDASLLLETAMAAYACDTRYIPHLAEKTDGNKVLFLKGLPDVIPNMGKRILLKKVLPPLLKELKKTTMISFVRAFTSHIYSFTGCCS